MTRVPMTSLTNLLDISTLWDEFEKARFQEMFPDYDRESDGEDETELIEIKVSHTVKPEPLSNNLKTIK
jgi:hypothetical protein